MFADALAVMAAVASSENTTDFLRDEIESLLQDCINCSALAKELWCHSLSLRHLDSMFSFVFGCITFKCLWHYRLERYLDFCPWCQNFDTNWCQNFDTKDRNPNIKSCLAVSDSELTPLCWISDCLTFIKINAISRWKRPQIKYADCLPAALTHCSPGAIEA